MLVPIDTSKLSRNYREDTLATLIFMKEKIGSRIKGRTCANGLKHPAYINKKILHP